MMESLYPFVVIGLCLSMVWMFYRIYKDQSTILPNISFFGTSIMYAVMLFMTDFSFYYKLLMMLPRDLIAFVMVFLLANNLKSTRAFFWTATGVGVLGYVIYSNFIPDTVQRLTHKDDTFIINNDYLDADAELMFDIKDEAQLSDIKEALKSYGVKIVKAFPNLRHEEYSELDDYYLLDIPNRCAYTVEEIQGFLAKTGATDWIEENEKVFLEKPIESILEETTDRIDYGINDPNLDQMWAFEKMNVAAYFRYLRSENIKPKKSAKIAILDTGVDGEHEDLKDNYVSTRKKYDKDKQTHGTHCAGIAASVSNNGKGVASLSMNDQFTKVTSIKVLSDYGWGTQDDIIRGIIEAADKGAQVISMSLGGPSRGNAREAYEEAVKYANRSGAIVVVAAGNSNKNARNYVPASCRGVITVSAVNNSLEKANFSNTVEDMKMGIAAPGVNILSTVPDNKYTAYSGTSMATPYVAGLLGIMKSINPKLTTAEAYNILKETGFDTKDTRLTGKMINPLEAVKALKK